MGVKDKVWAAVEPTINNWLAGLEAPRTLRTTVQNAIEAALAGVPEPVPGPFVLSEEESAAVLRHKDGYHKSFPYAIDETLGVYVAALDRALRTLGTPGPVEPLSDDLRETAARTLDRFALVAIAEKAPK